MAFLTERFPDRITRGMTGGPMFDTTVAVVLSGKEKRNINRSASQHRYDLSQGIKTEADADVCTAFFRKARGRAHAFRVKDWMDFRLTRAMSRLVQITTTTFQVSKVYGGDEPTFEEVRSLTRLVSGTLQVWKDTVLQTNPTHYTVNVDTGVVTFGSAPGAAVLEAACQFDVPCRFDFDAKDSELVHRKPDGTLLIRWESIALLEDMRG
jgi:uncharacterized protein (TIGR02217 family)